MQDLIDRHWDIQPAKGVQPSIPYKLGQSCRIAQHSGFYPLFELYYPTHDVEIMSEHVFDDDVEYHYVVKPLLVEDTFKVNHWDLLPKRVLAPSKVFSTLDMVNPGVPVRDVRTGLLTMVRGYTSDGVIIASGAVANPDTLVELMTGSQGHYLAESHVRTR